MFNDISLHLTGALEVYESEEAGGSLVRGVFALKGPMEERSPDQRRSQAAARMKPSLALANPNEIPAVRLPPRPYGLVTPQLLCL